MDPFYNYSHLNDFLEVCIKQKYYIYLSLDSTLPLTEGL